MPTVTQGHADSHTGTRRQSHRDTLTVTQGHTDSHTGTCRQSHRDTLTVTQGHTDSHTDKCDITTHGTVHHLLCGVPCSLSGDSHLPQNDGVLCVQFRLRQSINHYVPVFPAQWEEPRLQAPPLE